MKNNITSNTELLDIIKYNKVKNFNGVYPKDLMKKPLKDGFYIVNLDDSTGEGTHWCALYKINNGFSIWWDSYGFPAPENIESLIHKYEYNKKQIQDIDSSSCGFYCIGFILFLHKKQDKKKAFDIFCNLFKNNTKDNEYILYKLLYG
jgi:hypothetical protein